MSAIAAMPQNRVALKALLDSMGRRLGIIPFVGAGFSVPWCFPLWAQYLRTLAKHANSVAAIDRILQSHDFELAAQVLEQKLGRSRLNELIRKTYSRRID